MRFEGLVGASFAVAACLAGLCSSAALAGTKTGQFAVEEAGRAKCSAFIQAKDAKAPAYHRFVGFIEGYMTAANRYEPNTFDLTPWHNSGAFALILDQHCRKNADDTLVLAAQRLVAATQPLRIAEFSKLLEVGDGKSRTIVYETIMKRAQSILAKRGLYSGQVTGQFTPEMKSALIKFQQLAKLEPTGIPDPATLWVLLNP